VTYTPDWARLADALKLVKATGASEDQTKIDLCCAVADRKIDIRVKIAASDDGMRGQVFFDGDVGVPTHLNPHDFDWLQSRPLAQWSIGPKPGEHYSRIGGWKKRPLDLIELSIGDVTKILCGGEGADDNATKISESTAGDKSRAIKALAGHLKTNSELKRAEAEAWCKENDFHLSQRGFQSRVWAEARGQAGLPAKAPLGPGCIRVCVFSGRLTCACRLTRVPLLPRVDGVSCAFMEHACRKNPPQSKHTGNPAARVVSE